ncbi:hypothetical protein [Parahaliea aestuarii]|uniref:Tetratricopeptide repeat protein n=1 Tax=Parahaliea aestuarii TaxID=1852021 RepID=A0A5C8ZKY9_9GAMM|nr:hypothetical protein [Parahaliea aestuarii]TXS89108.1 hypothetical protein FVW59_18465 [Parahaliea aestuarii]
MSSDQDQLTPTPFEPAARQSSTESAAVAPQAAASPRWIMPALLVLVLVALAVVFLLPQPQPDGPATATSGVEAPGTESAQTPRTQGKPAPPDSSPWADAQQAELRKQAQDILARLLEQQRALQEQGVEQWAPDEFSAATALAKEGDDLYRERNFSAASERYQTALDALLAITESLPQRVEEQFSLARQAIEDGDTDALATHLERAALLAPDSPELAALQARAATLPQVLEALAAAEQAEADGDLAAASEQLKQASELDTQHQRVAAELARVQSLHTGQRFNRAMSEGYAALDAGRYSAAREAFKQARALRPDAGEVDSALAELQSSETAGRLAGLQRSGQNLEQAEDWQAAVESYQQALEIDASVVFAQEGLARAKPRAELQQELETIVDKPERLSDPTVAKATAKLLDQARAQSSRGPVLSQQIETIERLLATANQPVPVTLRSDQQTTVTVYRVARLGQFAEHELELRPGTYTAVGTRNGYRDVRRTFTISADTPPAPVHIACTEPI